MTSLLLLSTTYVGLISFSTDRTTSTFTSSCCSAEALSSNPAYFYCSCNIVTFNLYTIFLQINRPGRRGDCIRGRPYCWRPGQFICKRTAYCVVLTILHAQEKCIGLETFSTAATTRKCSFKFSIITVWLYAVFAIIGSVFFCYFHHVCCFFVCCVA